MTQEPPRLGVLSDEIDRLREHIDESFDNQNEKIERLTVQVSTTNGSVRELQRWRSYMEGVKAGAGGSWHVFIGATGALVGVGSLVTAIVVVMHGHG